MKNKKIISAIILLTFVLFSISAQEVNQFIKFQDRLKKGTSNIGLNINVIQHIETANAFENILSPSIEYSYFIINRFSINTSLMFRQSLFSYYHSNENFYLSHKSIDVWFRYYFFKRGGFFIGLGGSFGHILVEDEEFGRKFYAAPKFDIGYSYMISNLWKKIDNKVSVNFSIRTYIPYKSYKNFDEIDYYLPILPFFYAEIGVVYYFLKK